MADPVGDDVYARGIEAARAALTERTRPRPRPRAVPEPPAEPPAPKPAAPRARRPRPRAVAAPDPLVDDAGEVTAPTDDERDARIAELETENRRLRAALARIAETTRRALDDG